MKKFLTPLFCLLTAIIIFSGCKYKTAQNEVGALPYSPYVEAFTSGTVPRTASVYLILSQEVPTDKLTAEELNKVVTIKPAVEGTFGFEDARTIVFRPQTEMERNKQYAVTADLSAWFDVEKKDKLFSFTFATMPISLRASFDHLDINETNNDNYDAVFTVRTPDNEPAEIVESVIGFSEKADMVWQHSADGRKHTVRVSNLQPGDKGVRNLVMNANSNKYGVPDGELTSAYIPGKGDFGVYNIQYVSSPEKYIEITFTKLLDKKQEMNGLAYIVGNQSRIVNVNSNKIRLYPDPKSKGTLTVHIDRRIRSVDGLTMESTLSREVEIDTDKPDLKLIGEGVVIPQAPQLLIPFQTIYTKGVVVRVVKILENNIGPFLQENNLNQAYELIRVGRLVTRKTIFFDEEANDLTTWNTFAVDLKQLIEPEPGAIYRVELSLTKDLSLYPCEVNDEYTPRSKEQILADDPALLEQELKKYDSGSYYYYDDDDYYYYYDYEERQDPCSPGYYQNKKKSRNVLATNLGLIAKIGEENEMLVMVHNILSTSPEANVEVTVHNYQNQVIGSGSTDSKGQARIAFSGGKPYYIIAKQGKQRSYMRIDGGQSLSSSSFDVSGEIVQKGIKGFIYGERGVWRPGDTVYLGFMLNDRTGKLPADHPVIMELYNPMGQMVQRKTQTRGIMGLYAFDFATEADAPTGAWNVVVKVGGVEFNKRIRIETIKPNRLKIDFKTPKVIQKGEPLDADLHVEWLTGARAKNMKYEIDATFSTTTTRFDGYGEYVFDDPGKRFDFDDTQQITGTTDDQGDAVAEGSFSVGDNAPGMLNASFALRVYEESGDFSIDAVTVPFSPYKTYVGIRSPQRDGNYLPTGSNQRFELVTLTPEGSAKANTEVYVNIYKVSWYWWYDMNKSRIANYVADSYNKPVDSKQLTTDSNGKASFTLNYSDDQWGTYYIVVKDKWGGHSTGILSYFDWPYLDGQRSMDGSEAEDKLSFKTDKGTYAPGQKMTITVPSSKGSRIVVSIENGTRVLSVSEFEGAAKETTLKLDVTEDMQPNIYVNITLLQPHGMTQNDLPIRLYGIVPVTVTSPKSRITPVIKANDEIKPESKYEITVSEKEGREMAYTLAIVDEGLLDLTRFRTPSPWNAFNAREALGVTSWDMYKWIVGAYGGRVDQIFSIGGDDELENSGPKAIVNRFKPVVKFEGPFLLKKGGKQKHTYDMPNYTGRVRVMVVASTGAAYGNAEKSIMVRKPLMVLGTIPRVIGIGEEMTIPATVFTTENNVGAVKVTIQASDNMEIVGQATQELNFGEQGDQMTKFRLKVKNRGGAGKITIIATSRNDRSTYETDIEIRTVRREQVMVESFALVPGQKLNQSVSMPGVAGTNRLTLEVSDVQPINLSERIKYLLGYPHGCIEQITSKGFPQLYLKQFASLSSEQLRGIDEAVKEVIRRQKSYQTGDGGMAYWPGGSTSNGWGSIYAAHFMVEAEAKGYLVPEATKRQLINYLRSIARGWKPVENHYTRSEQLMQAYRLYVLAVSGNTELGAMNRLKEQPKLSDMARWQLAGAYAVAGRKDVAQSLIEQTTPVDYNYNEYDMTYGSDTRDRAIKLITLCLLDKPAEAAEMAKTISQELSSEKWMSTQTTAFALMGMSKYLDRYRVADNIEFGYSANGRADKVNTDKNVWTETLAENAGSTIPLEVTNAGKGTLFVRVIKAGTPDQGMEEAYASGVRLSVVYKDLNGNTVDVSNLQQGTNFSAEIEVINPTSRAMSNVVLTQIFPAGWEILNTRFTDDSNSDKLPDGVSYQDIRDDRVYTHMDRLPAGRRVSVKINLAAVYGGLFYLPPVYVDLMYDNTIKANTQGMNVKVE